jgi:DDE superfamily endonuclease
VPATLPCPGAVPQSGLLAGFREGFYQCLTRRADALFCLGDAVLCAGGRVTDLARLSLVPEFGRGHGALYDALNAGRADAGRLRRLLAGLPLPAWPDGRVRLAVDVTFWLRPDAQASPQRMLCRVKTRRGAAESVPGWPYSFVAALGPGPPGWVVPLDAVRIGPGDDPAGVTAAQLRGVVTRLAAAGHWKPGDPPVIIAADAGYNASRLAWLLRDLPVVLAVRVRADRCWRRAPGPRPPGTPGRPRRHGPRLRCADPATWDGARQARAASPRYGPLEVLAWPRLHQQLEHGSGGWDAPGPLPDVEGTLIRLSAPAALPGYLPLEPMWIWASDPDAAPAEVAVLWQAYLRRFDLEHFFRFIKSQLGWNKPLLRDPAAADRWTWIVTACYAQLHLARPLAAAARLPWQPPLPPEKATPGRVRAGFRRPRTQAGTPASPPKPATPGPGRPAGSKNKTPPPRPPVGKTHLKPVTQRINAQRQAKKQGKGG